MPHLGHPHTAGDLWVEADGGGTAWQHSGLDVEQHVAEATGDDADDVVGVRGTHDDAATSA